MMTPISPNEETAAQEQAMAIVSLIETIEVLITNYATFVETLSSEFKEEAKVYLGQLKALYSALDDSETDVSEYINNTLNLSNLAPSKIKRLGLVNEIVKLRTEQGMSYEDIGQRYGLTKKTVSRFLKHYEKLAPTQKNQLNRSDVYDIQNNMQTLHAALLRQMARFETDGESSVRFIGEYRQLIALAEKQLKEHSTSKKFDQVAILIEQTLLKHCTAEGREAVIQEFRRLGIKGLLSVETTAVRM